MTNYYKHNVEATAREVRVSILLGELTVERLEELADRVLAQAAENNVTPHTAGLDWITAVSTPGPDDQEIAELKAKWNSMGTEPETTGWYNKWFCENTMDMGLAYTAHYYRVCIDQYEEWEAEDTTLEHLKETYKEFQGEEERANCPKCQDIVKASGHRTNTDHLEKEHANH